MASRKTAKKRGSAAERDLIEKFWNSGWAAMRAAGSGSTQFPSPDIIAGKYGRRLVIECKLTADTKKYFSADEIRHLKFFAKIFSAEAWVSIKFPQKEWVFFNLEDLKETGKSFLATIDMIELKGLSFEEIIELDLFKR